MALWLIAAIGVGLIIYGGYQWYNLDELNPEQMKSSVELNYRMDIERMRAQAEDGELNLSEDWKDKHREAIREELEANMEKERETARSWMLAGLAALIFSLGRIFIVPLFRQD